MSMILSISPRAPPSLEIGDGVGAEVLLEEREHEGVVARIAGQRVILTRAENNVFSRRSGKTDPRLAKNVEDEIDLIASALAVLGTVTDDPLPSMRIASAVVSTCRNAVKLACITPPRI